MNIDKILMKARLLNKLGTLECKYGDLCYAKITDDKYIIQVPDGITKLKFETKRKSTMHNFLDNASAPLELYFSGGRDLVDMDCAFNNIKVSRVDLTHMELKKLRTIRRLFQDTPITYVDMHGLEMPELKSAFKAFKGLKCSTLDLSGVSAPLLKNVSSLFRDIKCDNVIDLSSITLACVTFCDQTFDGAKAEFYFGDNPRWEVLYNDAQEA